MPFTDISTMAVGVDIFQKRNTFSILGFCATVDQSFGKYVTIPQANEKGEEDISKYTSSMYAAMKEYCVANGKYPQRVIIFRDGVSDGQRQVVLSTEVPLIK